MYIWVRNTDPDWFRRISDRVACGEKDANFWIPSGKPMRAQCGELVLFKNPRHQIVGGGFFSRFISLPVQYAWEYFRSANGADSKDQLKQLLLRHIAEKITDVTEIGCAILNETFICFPKPVFLPSTRHTVRLKNIMRRLRMGGGYLKIPGVHYNSQPDSIWNWGRQLAICCNRPMALLHW